jgi:hypothetical protein
MMAFYFPREYYFPQGGSFGLDNGLYGTFLGLFLFAGQPTEQLGRIRTHKKFEK